MAATTSNFPMTAKQAAARFGIAYSTMRQLLARLGVPHVGSIYVIDEVVFSRLKAHFAERDQD